MNIQATLAKYRGNKTKAAAELGISRHKLLRMTGEPEPEPTPKRHLVIPDVQARDDVPLEHLEWIGKYIADKRPDSVIIIGDFNDLPSLSSYDKPGSKSFEGKRYKKDIAAGHRAMDLLMNPIARALNYDPDMKLTIGNHENRVDRVVENDPRLEDVISLSDLRYEQYGWDVIPFLEVVTIDDIQYSHYFTSGAMGRPSASAQVALRERQCSCVQGHVQHIDIAIHKKTQNFALFSGICYQHKENYLGAQGNSQKPGVWLLNEVTNGSADLLQVSLNYLRRRYA